MNPSVVSTRAREASSRPSGALLAAALALGMLGAGLGALSSLAGTGNWYQSLDKPAWAPQLWGFAGAWTLAGLLMGRSLAWLWASAPNARGRVWAIRWLWAVGAMSVLWSVSFWTLRAPSVGYMLTFWLWLGTLALIWTASSAARPTLWLLLPVLGWITWISAFNFAILSFNVIRPRVQAMDANPKNQDPRFLLREPTPIPGAVATPKPTPPQLF